MSSERAALRVEAIGPGLFHISRCRDEFTAVPVQHTVEAIPVCHQYHFPPPALDVGIEQDRNFSGIPSLLQGLHVKSLVDRLATPLDQGR